jgi:hypothetical protein
MTALWRFPASEVKHESVKALSPDDAMPSQP